MIDFVFAKSADPDKMLHYAAFIRQYFILVFTVCQSTGKSVLDNVKNLGQNILRYTVGNSLMSLIMSHSVG